VIGELLKKGSVVNTKKFDVVALGGGSGGLVFSKFAHGIGKKVAIIEKEKIGGECTWTGCVPSKALISIANSYRALQDLSRLGVLKSEVAAVHGERVMDAIHQAREQIYATQTPEVLGALGIATFFGEPRFLDAHRIQVGDTVIQAKKICITTGSRPFIPPVPGLDTVPYLTNQTIFEMPTIPRSLCIMGAGAIGIEIGAALAKLGTKVTMIEMQKRILAREDEELALLLQNKLRDDGVDTIMSAKVVRVSHTRVSHAGEATLVTYVREDGTEATVTCEKLLVATGRRPNIDGLDLERAGVAYNQRGIQVNRKLQTTAKHIYACGDVVGPYQFSHMAEHQAVTVGRNALLPFSRRIDYHNRAWVTFSDPEFASVGLHEAEARQRYGDSVIVYRIEYNKIDRPIIDRKPFGLAKFVCNKRGKLFGAQILGERAGEIIHEVQLGRSFRINFAKFDSLIHAYPTYSDVIKRGARVCRVSMIKNNFFVRLLQKFMKKVD